MCSSINRRGAFIVLEGLDRVGKTTQCLKVIETLRKRDGARPVEVLQFPDRTTSIGQLIGSYLEKKINLDDHAIHLLFSANRWERASLIKRKLESGITLIVDRYAFSGVAFTSAKPGFSVDWCMKPDVGLPRPDLVILLHLHPTTAITRSGFGLERYEKDAFQTLVQQQFRWLIKDTSVKCITIDGSQTIENVHNDIIRHSIAVIDAVEKTPLGELWHHLL